MGKGRRGKKMRRELFDETVEILINKKVMRDIGQALKEDKEGKTIPLSKL
jgi:hypothetical protein